MLDLRLRLVLRERQMPHSNNELDSHASAESPALHIDHGELRADVTVSTGRTWLGGSQDSCSVPSTAGSIKSDTINSNDADVYSYREEWGLGDTSSEPTTSRSIDGTASDFDSNNIPDDGGESDCELVALCQLKDEAASITDVKTPPSDPDEIEPDASLKDLGSTSALGEEAFEASFTPSSTPDSLRTSRASVNESTACENTRDSEVVVPDGNTVNASCTSTDIQDGEPRRIQVLVRVRPSTGSADDKVVVAVGEQGTSIQIQSSTSHGSLADALGAGGMTTVTECAFDRVFAASATQEDVFSAVEPSVRTAIDGYNATVFAYGQTGTGKTHTLFGKDFDAVDVVGIAAPSWTEEKGSNGNSRASTTSPRLTSIKPSPAPATAPTWGVVPRALRLLLSHAARLEADSAAVTTANEQVHVSLHCSFVQIYNDRLFDLFTDRRRQKPLLLREQPCADGSTNVVVPGLSSERILSVAHAFQLLRRDLENRSVRETEANLASSRSHAIVQVNITLERTSPTGERTARTSRLNLVDLAGSEKWNTDIPMDEAHSLELKNINASLSALGNCIAALAEPGRKHIPYRDSTLTRVLQDSLGGNTQSCLIATVSPSLNASDETIRTLRFADRARSVMQTVRINEASATNGSAAMMMTTELLIARTQIAKLREKLENTQRRHHETRLKELETCQRKFSEALKDKDREINKLTRENAGFLKWKEEDTRRIRELEAQVRELEEARGSKDQQTTDSAAFKVVRAPDDQSERTSDESGASGQGCADDDSPMSRTAETSDMRSGGAARVRRNDSTREMQRSTSKANLPRLASDRSKEVPPAAQGSRTYKQLLERYALQPSKSRRERGAEQRDWLPNATRQPELTSMCEVLSSDTSRSPHAAPLLSSLKDASYSASSPLLPIATRIPRVASVSPRELGVATTTEPSPSGFLAMRRSSSSLSPRLMECDATQTLCEAVSGWGVAAAKPAATSSTDLAQRVEAATFHSTSLTPVAGALNRPVTKVTGDIVEAWMGRTTSGDVQATSLPAALKPAASSGVCVKHSLRGCVLCSGAMDSNQPRLPVASQSGSTPMLRLPGEASSTTMCPISPDEACARHRLVRCFICSKVSDGGGFDSSGSAGSGKPLAAYPGESVTTSTDWRSDRIAIQYGSGATATASRAVAAASTTSSVGMNVLTSKCSAHLLSNCILCGNKGTPSISSSSAAVMSSSAPASEAATRTAQTLSTSYAEYPPRRYTLDARLLGLSSSSLSTSSTPSPSSLFPHSSASSMLSDERNGNDSPCQGIRSRSNYP